MIKLLTLNAFLLDVRLFGLIRVYPAAPHIEPRLKALPGALRKTGADVVCLQEMHRLPHRQFLAESLSGLYPHVAGIRQPGLPLGTGLMVLSRHPMASARFQEFKAAFFEERLAIRMGMLDCVMDLPGIGRCRVINTHMAAGGLNNHPESPKAEALRARQVDELLYLAGYGAGDRAGEAAILAGDFNSGPHSSAANYRQVTDAGYLDIFAEWGALPEMTRETTWDPANPLITGEQNRSLPPQRIDHVFLRRREAVRISAGKARVVLDEKSVALDSGQNIPVSDHYGLLVEIG